MMPNIKMPKISGPELIVQTRIQYPTIPAIIIRAIMNNQRRKVFFENGVATCLNKEEELKQLPELLQFI